MNNHSHLIVNHFFIGSSAGSPVISGGESGGSERDVIRLEKLGEKTKHYDDNISKWIFNRTLLR